MINGTSWPKCRQSPGEAQSRRDGPAQGPAIGQTGAIESHTQSQDQKIGKRKRGGF